MLANLLSVGVSLVRGVPTEFGECAKMANLLSTLRPTEWGTQFNVRAVPDSQQPGGAVKKDLAYTPFPIGMHTDNPYRDPFPGVQLLHCLKQAAGGGATTLTDGFAAAARLRAADPEAFALLARHAIWGVFRKS